MSLIKTLQFPHIRKLDSLWAREALVFHWVDFAFPAVSWALRSKLVCGPQPEKHLDKSIPLSPWIILLNSSGLLMHFQETMCFAGLSLKSPFV